ncbi:MAG: tetratricopeptide repeat protein, partial [Candidatus Aenigmatarchaeota archaeon]
MKIFWLLILVNGFFCAFAQNLKVEKALYSNYLKGAFYTQEGNFRKALEEFQKAKKQDPNSIYIRLRIANILVRLGDLVKAEKELKEAKKIDPNSF